MNKIHHHILDDDTWQKFLNYHSQVITKQDKTKQFVNKHFDKDSETFEVESGKVGEPYKISSYDSKKKKLEFTIILCLKL